MGSGGLSSSLASDDRDGSRHQGPRGCDLEKAGARRMRKGLSSSVRIAVVLIFLSSPMLRAQSIENFRWLDLRQPSDVQTIVARALMNEPYTALREVGYIGVPPKEP